MTTVVAIATDLMDRSKISGALEEVRFVRPGGDLAGVDIVLVDLSLPGALDDAVGSGARVIAYGSHVADDVLAAARASGAEALPRSVFFRRLTDGTLLD
jgi:hypothetical protein